MQTHKLSIHLEQLHEIFTLLEIFILLFCTNQDAAIKKDVLERNKDVFYNDRYIALK